MVRHTFKILQKMLQDFKSVYDHRGILSIKGLIFFFYKKISTLHFKIFKVCMTIVGHYVLKG